MLPCVVPLCWAQDSGRGHIPDSLTLDTLFRGPHYTFTGNEDPGLLASIFRHTYELGKQDAGELANPTALCLSIGRDSVVDAGDSVLDLLATHKPPVRPTSACKTSMNGRYAVTDTLTGKLAWSLAISALHYLNDSTVAAYSSFYVGPLFAAGWTCTAARSGTDWTIKSCTMRWIS